MSQRVVQRLAARVPDDPVEFWLRRSATMIVQLPRGFCDLISTCSAATGTSRNALLSRFLETGYIIYMRGQNTLLETMCSLQEERRAS